MRVIECKPGSDGEFSLPASYGFALQPAFDFVHGEGDFHGGLYVTGLPGTYPLYVFFDGSDSPLVVTNGDFHGAQQRLPRCRVRAIPTLSPFATAGTGAEYLGAWRAFLADHPGEFRARFGSPAMGLYQVVPEGMSLASARDGYSQQVKTGTPPAEGEEDDGFRILPQMQRLTYYFSADALGETAPAAGLIVTVYERPPIGGHYQVDTFDLDSEGPVITREVSTGAGRQLLRVNSGTLWVQVVARVEIG